MTPAPVLNLKLLIAMQSAAGAALTAILCGLFGLRLGASFGLGAVLMLGNLVLLAWIWSRLLAKKSIAWTVVIIVIKYTVLLSAIFFLSRETWFHVLGCGLGMVTFVMASLLQVALSTKA